MSRPTTTLLLIVSLAALGACSPRADLEADDATRANAPVTQQVSTEFMSDVRSSVADLGLKVDDLDALFADATDEARARWTASRAEIVQTRENLEGALMRVGDASAEQTDDMRSDIGIDLGNLTERIEMERLAALDSTAFVAAARMRVDELDSDIRALGASTARMAAGARRDAHQATWHQLGADSDQLKTAMTSLSSVTEPEVRTYITQRIAALSADVRRQWLEQRHGPAAPTVE